MAKRILIVGGVAGGASAAARLRRLDENATIVLFERGPDVSFAIFIDIANKLLRKIGECTTVVAPKAITSPQPDIAFFILDHTTDVFTYLH